jgi:hypothetical protein
MCGSRKATAIAALLSGKKYVDGSGGSCALAAPAKTTPVTAAALEKAQRNIAENPLFQPRRPWMYGALTIQYPLCKRIEAISCFASNHALKKHTGELQRHDTIAPTRISHRTNARLGGYSDRRVCGVVSMLTGGAGRRGECWNLLRCRRSEESVSVGLGMMPREQRDAAARVRRASRGRLRRRRGDG